MNAPHEEFYSMAREGPATASILEVFGDRELPDAHLGEAQRRLLKDLARSLRTRFSPPELAYLASAIEVQANELRAQKGLDGS